ncbi:hypothetical protein [Allonocardiopsis opalescens]|nr:hypothetical protein [Allonocardiopsis opalescens]
MSLYMEAAGPVHSRQAHTPVPPLPNRRGPSSIAAEVGPVELVTDAERARRAALADIADSEFAGPAEVGPLLDRFESESSALVAELGAETAALVERFAVETEALFDTPARGESAPVVQLSARRRGGWPVSGEAA